MQVKQLWKKAKSVESEYAKCIQREPIFGYNVELHSAQFRFITSRCARQIGLAGLDEQANIRKEKNFFETRVTEYQTGGTLCWD